jgi:hypothetical protein
MSNEPKMYGMHANSATGLRPYLPRTEPEMDAAMSPPREYIEYNALKKGGKKMY